MKGAWYQAEEPFDWDFALFTLSTLLSDWARLREFLQKS